eukprot:3027644-Prymnesium_polylepis.1
MMNCANWLSSSSATTTICHPPSAARHALKGRRRGKKHKGRRGHKGPVAPGREGWSERAGRKGL